MLPEQHCAPSYLPLPWRRVFRYALCFIHIQVTCSFLVMTMSLMPVQGASNEATEIPNPATANLSQMLANYSEPSSQAPPKNTPRDTTPKTTNSNKAVVQRTISPESDVPRDSPMALVIAASIAAVSILVFFILAYLWHTHQLDSRARKLAIRLAADAEHGMRCRNCSPRASTRYARSTPAAVSRPISESSQDRNHYEALTPEEDRLGPGSDGGRSSQAVSESEIGDVEDIFEPIHLPPIGERGRPGARGGRGSHRKWSRSRKTSSGPNLDKRDSAITDKDILAHFASRRHSTFFI